MGVFILLSGYHLWRPRSNLVAGIYPARRLYVTNKKFMVWEFDLIYFGSSQKVKCPRLWVINCSTKARGTTGTTPLNFRGKHQ